MGASRVFYGIFSGPQSIKFTYGSRVVLEGFVVLRFSLGIRASVFI